MSYRPLVRTTIWILSGAALLALDACVATIRHEYDGELDRAITYMHHNRIGRASHYTFYVNGAKIEELDRTRYVLRLEAHGDDWLRASNLTLLIDGAMLDFGGGARTAAEVACFIKSNLGASLGITPVDRCEFRETYEFEATWDQLGRLASASRVVMRVEGYQVYVLHSFSDENIRRFGEFVERCNAEADAAAADRGGSDPPSSGRPP